MHVWKARGPNPDASFFLRRVSGGVRIDIVDVNGFTWYAGRILHVSDDGLYACDYAGAQAVQAIGVETESQRVAINYAEDIYDPNVA